MKELFSDVIRDDPPFSRKQRLKPLRIEKDHLLTQRYPQARKVEVFHKVNQRVRFVESVLFKGGPIEVKVPRAIGWKIVNEWHRLNIEERPTFYLRLARRYGQISRFSWRYDLKQWHHPYKFRDYFGEEYEFFRKRTIVKKALKRPSNLKGVVWEVEPLQHWEFVLEALSKIMDIELALRSKEDLRKLQGPISRGRIFLPYAGAPQKNRALEIELDVSQRTNRGIRRILKDFQLRELRRYMADDVAVLPDEKGDLQMTPLSMFGFLLLSVSKDIGGKVEFGICEACGATFPIYGRKLNKGKKTCDNNCKTAKSRMK